MTTGQNTEDEKTPEAVVGGSKTVIALGPPKLMRLGKYVVSEKIGSGSYGVTYHGSDPLLAREVAIKVLRSELTAMPNFMDTFLREARTIASLRHTHIVTLIEVGEQDGRFFLVMDYLSGGSLQARLAELLQGGQPISLEKAVELLSPIAKALDYIHSKNIIHKNVKPSNVMYGEDGRVVLTDFGLIKSTPAKDINTPPVMGTPEYLSPEQIQEKSPGPATDVYALGIIAYLMLGGRLPFIGTPVEVFTKHLREAPPDVRTLNAGLPQEASEALLRALMKDPAKRFARASEFVEALDQIAMRTSQEQSRALYQAAKDHMKLLQFDLAINKLEQIRAIRANAEVDTLLQECIRRKRISDEINALRMEINQAQSRINQYISVEPWLKSTPTPGKEEKKRFGR